MKAKIIDTLGTNWKDTKDDVIWQGYLFDYHLLQEQEEKPVDIAMARKENYLYDPNLLLTDLEKDEISRGGWKEILNALFGPSGPGVKMDRMPTIPTSIWGRYKSIEQNNEIIRRYQQAPMAVKELFLKKYVDYNEKNLLQQTLWDTTAYQEFGKHWLYHGYIVEVEGIFQSEDERVLLVREVVMKREKRLNKLVQLVELEDKMQRASRRETISDEVKMFVWQRDQGRCVRCGSQENLEFDHIIPVAKGGSNTERNLQLLCEQCNREKSDSIGGL